MCDNVHENSHQTYIYIYTNLPKHERKIRLKQFKHETNANDHVDHCLTLSLVSFITVDRSMYPCCWNKACQARLAATRPIAIGSIFQRNILNKHCCTTGHGLPKPEMVRLGGQALAWGLCWDAKQPWPTSVTQVLSSWTQLRHGTRRILYPASEREKMNQHEPTGQPETTQKISFYRNVKVP